MYRKEKTTFFQHMKGNYRSNSGVEKTNKKERKEIDLDKREKKSPS